MKNNDFLKKRILVTGITGMAGSYMAELLIVKEHEVWGMVRRHTLLKQSNINNIQHKIKLMYGDLTDGESIRNIIKEVWPDIIFNFAAQSHVKVSWDIPKYTCDVTGMGVVRLLETIKQLKPDTKIVQASSSVGGNTPVLVRKNKKNIQLVNIEDLVNKNDDKHETKTYYDNLECLTIDDNYNIKFSNVKYVFCHSKKNLYRLKGSYGVDIEITGDHSVIIIDKKGKLIEKKIQNLKKNDFLISFCKEMNLTKKKYPTLKLVKGNIDKIAINKDFMRLFGYYLAEGNIYIKENKNYLVTWTFNIKKKSCVIDIKNILQNSPFKTLHLYHNIQKEKNTRKIQIGNKQLAYLILNSFKIGSRVKKLPSWIWHIPREGVIEFLRGYSEDAYIKENEIRYTSVNKKLIQEICYLAKMNGLDGAVTKRFCKTRLSSSKTIIKGSWAYDLQFHGRFADIILNKKTNRLKYRQLNADLVPATIIKNLEKGNIAYLCGDKKTISKQRIKDKTKNEIVLKLSNSGIGIVRIKKIEKIRGNHLVYDLHVPETQRFIGGNHPILLHNSEMYGKVKETPQNENTPFYPRSPYSIAKVMGYSAIINYRESYDLFASNAIFFNMEGARRSEDFVTRKITKAVAHIKKGLQKELFLGNLDAKRDWGWCEDYVQAAYLISEHNKPDDFVISSGETHTVKEFVIKAFEYVGLNWEDYVKFDKKFCRPTEVDILKGDSAKIKKVLGWKPTVGFEQIIERMVEADIKNIENG